MSAAPVTQAMAPAKIRAMIAVAVLSLAGCGVASAQAVPDAENGRYTMSPTAEGVLRLDTRSGALSSCSKSGAGWACYAVPDERAALDAEIGRLQADNERLKAELATRGPVASGKTDEALPKSDKSEPGVADPKAIKPNPGAPKTAESERRIEIPLPSDQDLDRMMSFLERAWRRLVDMANRMQKDVSGKI
jgi:hypothetical protein